MRKTRCLIVILLMVLGLISLEGRSASTSAATTPIMSARVRLDSISTWTQISILKGSFPAMNTYYVPPDVHQAADYFLLNPSISSASAFEDSFSNVDIANTTPSYGLSPILTSEGWLGSNYVKSATYRVPMPTNSSNTRFRGRVKMKSGNFYYFDVMIPQ